jgi:hypothetical protein
MSCDIDSVEPLKALPVHIFKRAECPAEQEIPFHVPNRTLNLAFALQTIQLAEPRDESIIAEILKVRIPCWGFRFYGPPNDDLFDVVIQVIIRISPKYSNAGLWHGMKVYRFVKMVNSTYPFSNS